MSVLSRVRREWDNTSISSRQNEKAIIIHHQQPLGYLAPQIQNSRLLSLPVEIQQKIYGYVFGRWSLGVFSQDEDNDQNIDKTFHLSSVGDKVIAGPPGCYLLLVCRSVYNVAHEQYGDSCTGTMTLGKLKGKMRRKLPTYLASHPIFRRFYNRIRRCFLYFSLNTGNFHINFRKMFPNLTYVDCLVHEGSYGPMVRLEGTTETFLKGQHNEELCDWTRPIVNHIVSSDGRLIRGVHESTCVFDDPNAILNIKLLGTAVKRKGVSLGFNYRWEGTRTRLVSHIVRDQYQLSYWEAGMGRREIRTIDIQEGEHVIPQRFRWVRHLKW